MLKPLIPVAFILLAAFMIWNKTPYWGWIVFAAFVIGALQSER